MSETGGGGRKNAGSAVNLDEVFRAWPEAEKPQEDWEARAQSVADRLSRGERGATAPYVTDEDLCKAPLGQTPEDEHNSALQERPMTMTADRERDRRSLQDLAKMAQGLTPSPASVRSVTPAPSGMMRAADARDSGIIDLAAASQADPYAVERAQSTPLASHGLFDDVAQPVPSVPPPPVYTHSQPPPSYVPRSVHPLPMAPRELPKKKGSGAVIALALTGVVALSAVAAGGLLFVRAKAQNTAVAVSQPAAEKPAAQPVEAKPAEATPPAATVAAAEQANPAADPNALPSASDNKLAMKSAPAKPAAKHEGAAGPIAKAEAPAKADGPAKLTEKDLVPQAPQGGGSGLDSAMRKEVGPDGPKPTQAAGSVGGSGSTGNIPQKPSQGAVTGALGAVLPGARSCLGPDDPISRASVVFASDGSVQSVNVSGGATGKPAEACIKGALSKAKLQPFAEPSYTANITIRHN